MFFSHSPKYNSLKRKINRYKLIGKDTTDLQLELDAMKEEHDDEKARKKEEEQKKKEK